MIKARTLLQKANLKNILPIVLANRTNLNGGY